MPIESTSQAIAQRAEQRLAAIAARRRVADRELEREIYEAATIQGLSQRQISDLVGNQSQATIQRILRRVNEDPSQLDIKPAEVIDQRTAGIITTEQMMDKLMNWQYSFGGVVRIGGVATDAYMTGDWDAIEMAFYRGQLSDKEFQKLADRQRDAPLP
ncbi:winged helix-turn-helix domain-containing protein [Mycobacteroides chelonae]|uniref:winged helix-turn-helix domain-containing protein n=1 Tax=Mycobacteroides chelonae TaxID=1774 RepID=UPI0008A9BE6C|nr:winged helix-turn-helix domain-containing protein [Mycobacteroides chelonae]AYM41829.1 winged helix-turn-helix domain-containing protein [[Mycobacterium] chelonae subsp. gwanakae]OHU11767.1 winged helix-turn-helix domain-containing protein [Mycobacteroides chelonae]